MATSSILKNIKLDDNAAKKLCEVLEKESPCKNIQPVSFDQLKRSEDIAIKWLSKQSH